MLTTNLDLALERAFAEAAVETSTLSRTSLADDTKGAFSTCRASRRRSSRYRTPTRVSRSTNERSSCKLLGQVDRQPDRRWESFAVTEDDHIDYLAQADVASLVPVTLVAKLRRSHFLFLGYPLRDWGLRVFLHRIWGREKVAYRSWAVEAAATPVEQELWRRRGVDVFDVPLDEYVNQLVERLAEAVR